MLEHDAKCRLLVERLRGAGNIRVSNARYWFLTYDETLPRFAARVPDNGDATPELPFCVSPSAWVQIIRALTPRTADFDKTVVDLLTSPYVGYRTAVNPTVVQEVIGRMDHFGDASPELALTVLTDTAKVHEIENAVATENSEAVAAAVTAAYSTKAQEMEAAVAASVEQAARAEEERRAARALAEDREQALTRSKEEVERTQREIGAARDRWEAESRRSSAELERIAKERDDATNALRAERQAAQDHRKHIRGVAIGLAVLIVGIAIAIALPLAVVSGKSAIAGSVIGGVAVILLGARIIAGRDWGGEIATWCGLLVAIAAIVVSLVIGAH